MLIQLEQIPEGTAVSRTLSASGDENQDSGNYFYQSQLPLRLGPWQQRLNSDEQSSMSCHVINVTHDQTQQDVG